MKKQRFFLVTMLISVLVAADKPATVLIRCDDIGMCHAVNVAAKEIAETGLPVNCSIMFVCPWYQEAVEMLKGHDNVCIGIHLTLNSEWKNYRWGPCAVTGSVASLVDEDGYFFPRKDLCYANEPKLAEIETELRAQIERAKNSGLDVKYCDTHMSTLDDQDDIHQLVVRLADEYGLIYSEFVADYRMKGMYSEAPENKEAALLNQVENLNRDELNLLVCHIGKVSPEMDALVDMNPSGPANMSRHRQAELKALKSPAFKKTVEKNNVILSTYVREFEKQKE